MERDGKHVFLLVLLGRIGDIILGDIVAEHQIPVHRAHQRIHVCGIITQRIQAADQAAHAGTHDHVHGDMQLLEIAYHTDVGGTLGTSATQDQRHRGAVFGPADPVELPGHFLEGGGIAFRVHAGRGQLCAKRQGHRQQHRCGGQAVQQILSHGLIACSCSFRPAGRRPPGCPRPARRGW